ncbi:MAG: type II secretion system protein GspN [Myxococcaceae bacterium]
MPPEPKSSRGKWIAVYVGFFIVALIFGVYVTFPYDALKSRAQMEAASAGYFVRMDSLGPGLFGVTAKDVKISKAIAEGSDTPPPSLQLESVSLRPALFPPGFAFRANAFGGVISGSIGGLGDIGLRVHLDEISLSEGNLKAFSGVDLSGKANADLALDIPRVAAPGSKVKEPDLAQANGNFDLNVDGLSVNGGTVTVPMYGEPTPMDLPKIVVGNVEGKIKFEKGIGTIEKFHGKGSDLELFLAGTLKLSRKLEYAEPAIDLKLKAEPDFVKRLGLIGAGLSMMGPDKTDPSFRAARITGYLGRPNFQPQR